MTNEEKQTELRELQESFNLGVINSTEYTEGITFIMMQKESAPSATTRNLGLQIFEDRKIIKVGECTIPFDKASKKRLTNVAMFLKDNPDEEKGQRKHYEN
jgi:hypothetical protein